MAKPTSLDAPGHTLPLADGRRRTERAVAPQPHLFLVLDCSHPAAPSARFSLTGLDEVLLGRGAALAHARTDVAGRRHLLVRAPDPWMSATHATLSRVLGRWVIEDAGSKNGVSVNGQPQGRAVLGDGDLVELGRTFFLYREALPTPPDAPEDEVAAGAPAPGLATLLPELRATFGRLGQVARSGISVVLAGETGTGKEVVARAIHVLSGRGGPFVAVNCGALPETLIETELFGYRRGAFSGAADDRPGLVRAADRGTLFLDEIGDLPLPSQAAFLRVLQEREVVPVGATRPVPVDVRLIAATHRDLDEQVARGELRADLYARLAGVKVTLPPLRERREDLGILVAALLARAVGAGAPIPSLDPGAARALFRHPWPLNVRELEKALAAAVVLAGDGPVGPEHLPPDVLAGGGRIPVAVTTPRPAAPASDDDDPSRPLGDDERRRRDELDALLREHRGNVSAVARAMGKARMQIQRWIKRYALDPEAYRDA